MINNVDIIVPSNNKERQLMVEKEKKRKEKFGIRIKQVNSIFQYFYLPTGLVFVNCVSAWSLRAEAKPSQQCKLEFIFLFHQIFQFHSASLLQLQPQSPFRRTGSHVCVQRLATKQLSQPCLKYQRHQEHRNWTLSSKLQDPFSGSQQRAWKPAQSSEGLRDS